MRPTLNLLAKRIALFLGFIAVLLAVQSIAGKHIEAGAGDDAPELLTTLVRIFNINREQSLPTWYSASLLLLCALAVGVIAYFKRLNREPYRHHWIALALIFVYLSADEAAGLHEYWTEPLGEALDTTGGLYFAWVIVGAVAVIVFGLAFFRFWLHLEPRTRRLYVLACAVYVGGSIGVEMISANEWYLNDGSTLTYSLIGTIEELMEMLGVVIFFYAQLAYLARYVGEFSVAIRDRQHAVVPSPAPDSVSATPAYD